MMGGLFGMLNKRRLVIAAGLWAFLWAVPGCTGRLPERPIKNVAVISVVLDVSQSTASERRCAELRARVAEHLRAPGVQHFEAAVYMTGDLSTNDEPVILPWSRWDRPRPKLFAPTDGVEVRKAQEIWLKDIEGACESTFRPTRRTPLYRAILRAVQSSRVRCAELEGRRQRCSTRTLLIDSDFQETAERVAARLGTLPRTRGRRSEKPLTIDTSGLTISACGLSNQRANGRGKTNGEDPIVVWQQILGPALKGIDAACPLPADVVQGGGR